MNKFKKNGYLFVKNFISQELVKVTLDYVEFKLKTSGLVHDSEPQFIPNSLTLYGDHLTESVLKNSMSKMEKLTGHELIPSYSFMRLYKKGDRLPKHRDRLTSQIAVSLCIGSSYEGEDYDWPFYLDGKEFNCKPGDAVIYNGIESFHWREPLERDWHLPIFLFYMDKNAEFADDLIYDARPELGHPRSSQKLDVRAYEKKYFEARGYVDAGRVTYLD